MCVSLDTVSAGMVKQGLSPEEAAARFYVLDHHGLITQKVLLVILHIIFICYLFGRPRAQTPRSSAPLLASPASSLLSLQRGACATRASRCWHGSAAALTVIAPSLPSPQLG